MRARTTWFNQKVHRRCLKCGRHILTTRFERICRTCHRANDRLHHSVVRIVLDEEELDGWDTE